MRREGRSFMHLQYYSECRLGWKKERRGNICFSSPLFSLPIFECHSGWIWNVKTSISSFSHPKVYHHVFPPQMWMSSSYLEISSLLPSPFVLFLPLSLHTGVIISAVLLYLFHWYSHYPFPFSFLSSPSRDIYSSLPHLSFTFSFFF